MGKTVESYRMALEEQISRWTGFARALRSEERTAFDIMMDACRNHASAGSNATNPILFEPMVMSILLQQQVSLQRLQKELDALKQQPTSKS
jgi:hypothetical protein